MPSDLNKKIFEDIEEGQKKWQEKLDEAFGSKPERLERFSTVSDREIQRIYTPADVKDQAFI